MVQTTAEAVANALRNNPQPGNYEVFAVSKEILETGLKLANEQGFRSKVSDAPEETTVGEEKAWKLTVFPMQLHK